MRSVEEMLLDLIHIVSPNLRSMSRNCCLTRPSYEFASWEEGSQDGQTSSSILICDTASWRYEACSSHAPDFSDGDAKFTLNLARRTGSGI